MGVGAELQAGAAMIIEIYAGPDACQKCFGWKKIANDDDQSSWKFWAELPAPSNLAVLAGLVFPIDCPRCLGSGKEPHAIVRAARLETALDRLQWAWDGLSRCVDEFAPDDAAACSEYGDALDTAIVETLTAWREKR